MTWHNHQQFIKIGTIITCVVKLNWECPSGSVSRASRDRFHHLDPSPCFSHHSTGPCWVQGIILLTVAETNTKETSSQWTSCFCLPNAVVLPLTMTFSMLYKPRISTSSLSLEKGSWTLTLYKCYLWTQKWKCFLNVLCSMSLWSLWYIIQLII